MRTSPTVVHGRRLLNQSSWGVQICLRLSDLDHAIYLFVFIVIILRKDYSLVSSRAISRTANVAHGIGAHRDVMIYSFDRVILRQY